jgi:hypothetical protein
MPRNKCQVCCFLLLTRAQTSPVLCDMESSKLVTPTCNPGIRSGGFNAPCEIATNEHFVAHAFCIEDQRAQQPAFCEPYTALRCSRIELHGAKSARVGLQTSTARMQSICSPERLFTVGPQRPTPHAGPVHQVCLEPCSKSFCVWFSSLVLTPA